MAKTKKKAQKKVRGKNRNYQHASVEISRCPKCGSTDRTKYFNRIVQPFPGVRCGDCNLLGPPAAQCVCGGTFDRPFNRIIRRRTQCADCGQFRIDRSYE